MQKESGKHWKRSFSSPAVLVLIGALTSSVTFAWSSIKANSVKKTRKSKMGELSSSKFRTSFEGGNTGGTGKKDLVFSENFGNYKNKKHTLNQQTTLQPLDMLAPMRAEWGHVNDGGALLLFQQKCTAVQIKPNPALPDFSFENLIIPSPKTQAVRTSPYDEAVKPEQRTVALDSNFIEKPEQLVKEEEVIPMQEPVFAQATEILDEIVDLSLERREAARPQEEERTPVPLKTKSSALENKKIIKRADNLESVSKGQVRPENKDKVPGRVTQDDIKKRQELRNYMKEKAEDRRKGMRYEEDLLEEGEEAVLSSRKDLFTIMRAALEKAFSAKKSKEKQTVLTVDEIHELPGVQSGNLFQGQEVKTDIAQDILIIPGAGAPPPTAPPLPLFFQISAKNWRDQKADLDKKALQETADMRKKWAESQVVKAKKADDRQTALNDEIKNAVLKQVKIPQDKQFDGATAENDHKISALELLGARKRRKSTSGALLEASQKNLQERKAKAVEEKEQREKQAEEENAKKRAATVVGRIPFLKSDQQDDSSWAFYEDLETQLNEGKRNKTTINPSPLSQLRISQTAAASSMTTATPSSNQDSDDDDPFRVYNTDSDSDDEDDTEDKSLMQAASSQQRVFQDALSKRFSAFNGRKKTENPKKSALNLAKKDDFNQQHRALATLFNTRTQGGKPSSAPPVISQLKALALPESVAGNLSPSNSGEMPVLKPAPRPIAASSNTSASGMGSNLFQDLQKGKRLKKVLPSNASQSESKKGAEKGAALFTKDKEALKKINEMMRISHTRHTPKISSNDSDWED